MALVTLFWQYGLSYFISFDDLMNEAGCLHTVVVDLLTEMVKKSFSRFGKRRSSRV